MTELEAIVEHWQAGESISEIAHAFGCSRQAISQRLIRAGYSPAERRAQAKAMSPDATPYEESRAESVSSRVENRERARRDLAALAVELGCSPMQAAETERGREACKPYSPHHVARLLVSK